MRQIKRHMQQLAARQFLSVLPGTPYAHECFKAADTAEIEEGSKLLLVGSANRDFDDGCCIALPNSELRLIDEIPPGCVYNDAILSEQARQRYDAVVVTLNGGEWRDGVAIGSCSARPPLPSRFCVT